MSRESFISYLIEHEHDNFLYKKYLDKDDYLEFAIAETKKVTGRKMQKLAIDNFVQEAVLNIKKDTSIEEVENLFKLFSSNRFKNQEAGGFKVFEIAIHKDEGVFIYSKYNIEDLKFDSKTLKVFKDGIDISDEVFSFAPNRDIFYNLKSKKWYKEKEFKTEIDKSTLQKKMNYHAHISFTKWDKKTGKNIRLQKGDLQKIQTITANEMRMERGEINSQTKRLNHYQIKKLQAENNDQKKENLATFKDLKLTIKDLRIKLKESGATRPDYANLEALNKKLIDKIKNKDLTILQLQKELKAPKKDISTQNENDKIKKLADLAAQEINKLKETLEEAVYKIEQQEKTIKAYKQELLSYRGSDRQIMRKELSDLQFENRGLKKEIELLKNKPIPNAKNSQEYRTLQIEYDKLYSSFLQLSNEQGHEIQSRISPRP